MSQRWSENCWLFTHSWFFRSSWFPLPKKLAASFCPFYSIVCTSAFLLVVCLQVWKYLDSAVWVLFILTLEEHHVLATSQMLLYCRCCHWFPVVSVTTFSLLSAEYRVTKWSLDTQITGCGLYQTKFILMAIYLNFCCIDFSEIMSSCFLFSFLY